MAAFTTESVLSVRHWTDTVFSFTATRSPSLRFESGQFVMIGLEVEGRPLTRAYSIVSANYDDYLEFLSIKVVVLDIVVARVRIIANERVSECVDAWKRRGEDQKS